MTPLHIAATLFFALCLVVAVVVIACDVRRSWHHFLDTREDQ